jgi:hypothetical protein
LWRRAKAIPSLDLRFAENKSLVDATTGQNLVTFTRASSGTYVDSQGVIQRAVTNLLLRSEEFDQSPWSALDGLSRTANQIAAPNDTLTADLLASNGSQIGYIEQPGGVASQFVNGATYTFSIYLKKANTSTALTLLYGATFNSGGSNAVATWNLDTGVPSFYNGATGSMTAVGNGWYRCVMTDTATASETRNQQWLRMSSNSGDVYAWGAQLEQSSTVGEYIPTTSTINSAPRFDHNPTTGESLGLLVEEQRTNLLLRSEEFNDASWTKGSSVSVSANTVIAPNGTLTADTVTADSGFGVFQTITSVIGVNYSNSIYVKAGTAASMMFRDDTGAGRHIIFNPLTGVITSTAGTLVSSGSQAVGDGWYRYWMVYVADATSVRGIIRPNSAGSAQTFAVWGAQLEAGAFPTSYIPTTTATVTRSADVASITGSNFSSWYRQSEGTVFSEFSAATYSTASYAISDGTNSNRIMVDRGSTGTRYVITNAGVAQTGGAQTPYTLNSFVKTSLGYALDNCNLAAGGVLQTLDTSATIPSVLDRLLLGVNAGGAGYGNGPIKRFTFWPRRLSDSTLQGITQ